MTGVFGNVTADFGNAPEIGHDKTKSPVTIRRNGRSRSTEMSGHDGPRYAGALYQLGRQLLQNRRASTHTLQQMVHNLQDDLLRMGLKEDEEEYLIDRIDHSAEDTLDAMDAGSELATSFSFVHNNLKQIIAQQETLAQAFDHILSQQQQVEQSAAGDIELF